MIVLGLAKQVFIQKLLFTFMQCQHTTMKKHKVAAESDYPQTSLTFIFHLLHSSFSDASLKFVSQKVCKTIAQKLDGVAR